MDSSSSAARRASVQDLEREFLSLQRSLDLSPTSSRSSGSTLRHFSMIDVKEVPLNSQSPTQSPPSPTSIPTSIPASPPPISTSIPISIPLSPSPPPPQQQHYQPQQQHQHQHQHQQPLPSKNPLLSLLPIRRPKLSFRKSLLSFSTPTRRTASVSTANISLPVPLDASREKLKNKLRASASLLSLSASLSGPVAVPAHQHHLSQLDTLLSLASVPNITPFSTYLDSLPPSSPPLVKLSVSNHSQIFIQKTRPTATVYKIIPFSLDQLPSQTPIQSIIQELQITKLLSALPGFISLLNVSVVRGKYPKQLASQLNTSSNAFPDTQLYCIIAQEDAGTDLRSKHIGSWVDAESVFWQTVIVLAEAEQYCQFEHRDLHCGNIVVADVWQVQRRYSEGVMNSSSISTTGTPISITGTPISPTIGTPISPTIGTPNSITPPSISITPSFNSTTATSSSTTPSPISTTPTLLPRPASAFDLPTSHFDMPSPVTTFAPAFTSPNPNLGSFPGAAPNSPNYHAQFLQLAQTPHTRAWLRYLQEARKLVLLRSSLRVTLIDYSLSRAYNILDCPPAVIHTRMDQPDFFRGKGDYQFDIYRHMRAHVTAATSSSSSSSSPSSSSVPPSTERKRVRRIKSLSISATPKPTDLDWAKFCPHTNVLWLHYLVTKLLARPVARRNRPAQQELRAWRALEKVAAAIDPRAKGAFFDYRLAVQENAKCGSAGDVIKWAIRARVFPGTEGM